MLLITITNYIINKLLSLVISARLLSLIRAFFTIVGPYSMEPLYKGHNLMDTIFRIF